MQPVRLSGACQPWLEERRQVERVGACCAAQIGGRPTPESTPERPGRGGITQVIDVKDVEKTAVRSIGLPKIPIDSGLRI
jgi:hypothetical protein